MLFKTNIYFKELTIYILKGFFNKENLNLTFIYVICYKYCKLNNFKNQIFKYLRESVKNEFKGPQRHRPKVTIKDKY
jgi:hypothetical protein